MKGRNVRTLQRACRIIRDSEKDLTIKQICEAWGGGQTEPTVHQLAGIISRHRLFFVKTGPVFVKYSGEVTPKIKSKGYPTPTWSLSAGGEAFANTKVRTRMGESYAENLV